MLVLDSRELTHEKLGLIIWFRLESLWP